ncbi:MAG: CDGSH iron-sulfur domain-containing protein [Polyangiaceae bacterium]
MADGVEEVRGKKLLIQFEGKKCIHSRACVLTRPDVFVPNVEGEWIHPDAASVEAVTALAHACPSGAIRYERLDGGEPEAAPIVNVVRVRENGPLAVHAELEIDGAPAGFRATLCRCGASKRKPYCDASHVAAGFRETGEPPTEESTPLAQRNGPLRVTPTKDGPLKVEGNVEIVSGTGRTMNRATKAFLCRCGQSAKKPYCDGTHKKVGFTSD